MIPNLASIHCAECPIRHSAVCARCEPDELEFLETTKYYRNYAAGQTIVWAGDEMGFVASMITGVATLSQTMVDGRTQTLGLLLPSDFIGSPGRATSSYDITAVTDVTLCCFRRKPFQKLLTSNANISDRLLEMTLDELDAAREWMLLLGRKTAREKIASLLVIIARRQAALDVERIDGAMDIDLPLTREAMADYLGLTLETVSRQMSAFRREGIIVPNGKRHIKVPDFPRLMHETGDDASQ
jgi:CRP/FNR family transcriptional regulator